MKQLADTGFPDSLAQTTTGVTEPALKLLEAQTQPLIKRLAESITAYDSKTLEIYYATIVIVINFSVLSSLLKDIIVDAFVQLLKFTFLNR